MLPTEEASQSSGVMPKDNRQSATICACIQERLTRCPYGHSFNRVTWNYFGGTLTLQGCVPSFYLKQILYTIVRDIEHVERIENAVDVVSSVGLSSERLNRGSYERTADTSGEKHERTA